MAAPVIRIEGGDMLDVLPRLLAEGAKVHAIVTDPPYHLTSIVKRFGNEAPSNMHAGTMPPNRGPQYKRLSRGFMGKQWDGGDIAFRPETWRACYDLLPPGGYLLAFAGTRTYHRIACAIEDAGFEIRDMLAWLYGSGFPKSHNVGKGIDRAAGAEREVVEIGATRSRGMTGGAYIGGDGKPETRTTTAPATDDARVWDGWGTALKPALEPLCIARKPLAGTVAANVLAHGTGALNIDGCRIEANGRPNIEKLTGLPDTEGHQIFGEGLSPGSRHAGTTDEGRWPANVAHDGSAEVEGAFPDSGNGGPVRELKRNAKPDRADGYGMDKGDSPPSGQSFGDAGNAARFFYSAKADSDDRLGSKHPTVKPVDLMRWLVRLVTPPGGTVLDPFAGSGTTGMACMAEGFNAILVERDGEYLADIRQRIAHVHGHDLPLFK